MGLFSEKSKFEQIKAEKYHDAIVAKRKRIIVRIIIVAAVILGIYFAASFFFTRYFYPRTVINGVNCSVKTVSTCDGLLKQGIDGYVLTLYEQNGETAEITGEEIDLELLPEETIEELLDEQNGFSWIAHLFRSTEINFDVPVTYSESKLEAAMYRLDFLDEDTTVYPEEPSLSDYIDGVGYEVIDPVYGNVINRSTLLENMNGAVSQLVPTLHLAETGCYEGADFRTELAWLEQVRDMLNQVVNTTITYEFGSEQVVLDGAQINEWLVIREETGTDSEEDESGEEGARELTVQELADDRGGSIDLDRVTIHVNTDRLAEFVYDMAYKYNTKYQYHQLTTHAGNEITVGGGNYGWLMDQTSTLNDLIGYLEAGEDYTGEAVFTQRAAQFDFPDYGYTYLEVSLSAQHFWYYRDGVLTLESDLVSGNPNTGHATPTGTYQIAYKARDQILSGEGYSSPVSYWMPFYAGVGFHDASWRSSFGGTIYQYSGSHGCLNLPFSVAQELYGYIEGGEAVLIY